MGSEGTKYVQFFFSVVVPGAYNFPFFIIANTIRYLCTRTNSHSLDLRLVKSLRRITHQGNHYNSNILAQAVYDESIPQFTS